MSSPHENAVLRSYTIGGDLELADVGAIEVTITLADEERRWCFFMTPQALASSGDFLSGTSVRIHRGELHMIVVSEISRDVIERVLRELQEECELVSRTLPLRLSRGSDAPAS